MLGGEDDLLYLITSELTNQREPKALFTRVVYTISLQLDHWIMQFKTFYSLSHYGISANTP